MKQAVKKFCVLRLHLFLLLKAWFFTCLYDYLRGIYHVLSSFRVKGPSWLLTCSFSDLPTVRLDVHEYVHHVHHWWPLWSVLKVFMIPPLKMILDMWPLEYGCVKRSCMYSNMHSAYIIVRLIYCFVCVYYLPGKKKLGWIAWKNSATLL